MNVLDVADQQRILTLLGRSWSIRRVSRETGYRHETIRRYAKGLTFFQFAGTVLAQKSEVPVTRYVLRV